MIVKEVILQNVISKKRYTGTVKTETISVHQRAFGHRNLSIDEWRALNLDQIIEYFREYANENRLWKAKRFLLDLESQRSIVDPENWETIEKCIAAVLVVLGSDVEIGIYGTPFPPRSAAQIERDYPESTVEFVTDRFDFAVPVLYIKERDGWLSSVEPNMHLSLSVFPASFCMPILSHKLLRPGENPEDRPNLFEVDAELENTIKLQLGMCKEAGVKHVFFWHGEDHPDIEKTMRILDKDSPKIGPPPRRRTRRRRSRR
jgi:hypothetical protein